MKFDSKRAEREYITTNTSYRALAEKYEVSQSYLAHYGCRNGWVQKRADYKSKVHQKSIEKAAEQEVDKLAKCKTATDKAIARVDEMIENVQTAQDVRAIAAALKDLIGMQRDLHGILSKKDELQLHQEAEGTGETGIVYIPPLVADADVVVKEGDANA